MTALLQPILRAEENDGGYTLDLPLDKDVVLPPWLEEPFADSAATFARIFFPIKPPPEGSDLAVTFYFDEPEGGFLRVFWKGENKAETLSDNLYEGVGMPNQRTLLIHRSTFETPGILSVQSSDALLHVTRVHWEWVQPKAVLTTKGAPSVALVKNDGKIMEDAEVSGDPAPFSEDQVKEKVVSAPLTEKPVRIEKGIAFDAPLQTIPQWARLDGLFNGVPMGRPMLLWINGTQVGEVSLDVPDLSDPGYRGDSSGAPQYVGWRKGVIYFDAQRLQTGDNQFQFGLAAKGNEEAPPPLAVKNLVLQIKYLETLRAQGSTHDDSEGSAVRKINVPQPPIP